MIRPLCVFLLLGLAATAQPQETKKQPMPDKAALTSAEGLIRKLFQEDYAKAKNDAKLRKTLAATLLREGKETKDSWPLRYVALREAVDLAALSGDLVTALQAVAVLNGDFQIDALALRLSALEIASQNAEGDAHKPIVQTALGFVDEALAGENLIGAERLLSLAQTSAEKARSLPLLATVQKRQEQVRGMLSELETIKPALATLQKNPNDAQANLKVGLYYALNKGKWEQGLPFLAKSQEKPLSDIARKDLENPKDATTRAEVGDGWWMLAEKEKPNEKEKKQLLSRAAFWYRQAAPQLTGLSKVKVEQRLKEIGEVAAVTPTVPVTPVAVAVDKFGSLRVLKGHTRPVQTVAISPDNRLAVSGGDDDELRLWEVETGKPIGSLKGHANQVWSVAFSPDGKYILSGSDDKTVRLWNVKEQREVRKFEGATKNVNRVVFSPDGKYVLAGSDDNLARLWELETGKEIRKFDGHQRPIWGAVFSKDGTKLITGSFDKTIGIWDVATGKELRTIEAHNDGILSVAISPDGKWIASASTDKTIKIWEMETGKELHRLTLHNATVYSVAFSPDGKRLVSAGQDKTIRIWDAASGKELSKLDGHTNEVVCAVYSLDGRYILSASLDQTVRVWGAP